jgi:hypothetical protein
VNIFTSWSSGSRVETRACSTFTASRAVKLLQVFS